MFIVLGFIATFLLYVLRFIVVELCVLC
jgi:hypothetical protein